MNKVTFNLKDDILKAVAESDKKSTKLTVQELLNKLQRIDHAILTVEQQLPKNYFPGQEPLCDVIDILAEYRDDIMNSQVYIR